MNPVQKCLGNLLKGNQYQFECMIHSRFHNSTILGTNIWGSPSQFYKCLTPTIPTLILQLQYSMVIIFSSLCSALFLFSSTRYWIYCPMKIWSEELYSWSYRPTLNGILSVLYFLLRLPWLLFKFQSYIGSHSKYF